MLNDHLIGPFTLFPANVVAGLISHGSSGYLLFSGPRSLIQHGLTLGGSQLWVSSTIVAIRSPQHKCPGCFLLRDIFDKVAHCSSQAWGDRRYIDCGTEVKEWLNCTSGAMVKVDTRTKKSSERRSRRTTRRPKSLDPMKAFLAAIGTMTGRY